MGAFRLIIAVTFLSLLTQCQAIVGSDQCYSSPVIRYTLPDECDYSKIGLFDYVFNSTDVHCVSHKKSDGDGCKRLNNIVLIARNCSMRGANKSAVHCAAVETIPPQPQLLILDYKFFDCECDQHHIRNCFVSTVARNYDIWIVISALILIFSLILLYIFDVSFRGFVNAVFSIVGLLSLISLLLSIIDSDDYNYRMGLGKLE